MNHRWATGTHRTDWESARLHDGVPELLPPVTAHRSRRGPFTAAGSIARAVVPEALRRWPDLVERHVVELLSVAPELRDVVPASRETLTSLAVPTERTRFYSRLRSGRLGHGVVEFLREHLRLLDAGPLALVVLDAHEADPTDAEFLAALLRRVDPALLTVAVATAGPVDDRLRAALEAHAVPLPAPSAHRVPVTDDDAAAALFVASDCTDALHADAYHRVPANVRASLHDRRHAELLALGGFSWRLGAIPLHAERGSDPTGTGVPALREALDYCVDMGFYHATIHFGQRGRAVVDWVEDVGQWWQFTTKMTVSLAALGRPAEAEALYAEAVASTDNPRVHMQASYATGMIYTRHNLVEDRDHRRAKALLNQAIAFATLLFDGKERAFRVVFNRNGLALVESHLGNLPEALRLVTEGLELLDAELELHEHQLHRSVLMHNKAQVLMGLGRFDEALAAFDAVIAVDPNYPDYHLDRGNALHRLGRDDEALESYQTAIRLGPPFPEALYNCAELHLDAGNTAAARDALDHVLELDPDLVDAYVNRAGLHLEDGDPDAALRDAETGLALDSDNPLLHCAAGQAHAERGEPALAAASLDRALSLAPALGTALAARAALAHEEGDGTTALHMLGAAIDADPADAALRYNRAFVHQDLGDWDQALVDLRAAAELAPEDEEIAEALNHCTERATAVS
jgi:tetratricopeptide (TPR) repeat protein